jgi:hypothetical protein
MKLILRRYELVPGYDCPAYATCKVNPKAVYTYFLLFEADQILQNRDVLP